VALEVSRSIREGGTIAEGPVALPVPSIDPACLEFHRTVFALGGLTMGKRGRRSLRAFVGVATAVAVFAFAHAAPSLVETAKSRPPTALDTAVLEEINGARTDPAGYIAKLRGPDAAEAIDFLRRQAPIAPLTFDPRLSAVAAAHAADEGPKGLFSHTGSDGSSPRLRIQGAGVWSSTFAEEISLAQDTAAGVVRQLIIDASSPGRPHRADLFDPRLRFAGVGCGPNARFRTMCVIDLTGPQLAAPGSEQALMSRGDGIAPVTPESTTCPWPSGKISVHMVDAEVYSAVLYGTSDTFTSLADILTQLRGKVAPHYDPRGICGKCIQQLDIWGHGDTGGGFVSFGPEDAQIGNAVMGANVDQNLAGVGALMCIGGKVVINQCNAGKGARGTQALQALADKIGVPVSGPTDKIKGCRIFGGALTDYAERSPGPNARTPAQNQAGPVSATPP
jgi:hypothetical protein